MRWDYVNKKPAADLRKSRKKRKFSDDSEENESEDDY